MSIERSQIVVNGLPIQIVRKAIKNLHLGVYPPDGRVRVAVPLAVTDRAVRLAVTGKLGWIKRQQARFETQPRQSKREMVTGETHYFLGRRYRLRVVLQDAPASVVIRNRSFMDLHVRRGCDTKARARLMQNWYRHQLKSLIPPLLRRWEKRLNVQTS